MRFSTLHSSCNTQCLLTWESCQPNRIDVYCNNTRRDMPRKTPMKKTGIASSILRFWNRIMMSGMCHVFPSRWIEFLRSFATGGASQSGSVFSTSPGDAGSFLGLSGMSARTGKHSRSDISPIAMGEKREIPAVHEASGGVISSVSMKHEYT